MAKFCQNCGGSLTPEQDICLGCGVKVNKQTQQQSTPIFDTSDGKKSKTLAAVLAFFFGTWGVHNFYLGYTNKAVTQLVLSIVGYILCIVFIGIFMVIGVGIWALVEAIQLLTGSISTDAQGNPLSN